MNLSTPVAVAPSLLRLSQDRPILLIGSCFTESIGLRLKDFGFRVMMNPFGILYNPLSIAECLRRCLIGEEITENELVERDGLWHSWLHHGSFSHPAKEDCLAACNQRLHQAQNLLKENPLVILTLGTAWVYEHKGRVVANCHKVPGKEFTKRLLTIDEIVAAYAPLPLPQTLWTVSPIRHWADGAHGNQLSKSTLLLASEQLQGEYFPAYEIVMDELRDYRFYDRDMLHPSPLAVDIVWERFQQTYMDTPTLTLGQECHQQNKRMAHKPIHPNK